MPLSVPFNGQVYTIPLPGENYGWGGGVTSYLQALSITFTPATASFPLAQEVDFGAAFGFRTLYIRSRSANPAQFGVVRLARADEIRFRNQANSADLALGVNTSNQLTFNGVVLSSSTGTVTSISVLPGSSKISTTGSPITSSGTINVDVNEGNLTLNNIGGILGVPKGGSGVSTITGYLKGNGASAFTGSATIPTSDLSGTISLTTQVSGVLPIANGGTGQNTANAALNALLPAQTASTFLKSNGTSTTFALVTKSDVGLGNADNTSDVNKPVSTAQAAAIAAAVPLTTKGDVLTFSTVAVRLAVGADRQVLSADSAQPSGLAWKNSSASVSVNVSSGGNYSAPDGMNAIILQVPGPGAPTATFTVNLPTAPSAGDQCFIGTRGNDITALTVACPGQTVFDAPTTSTALQGFGFVFVASTGWFRLY